MPCTDFDRIAQRTWQETHGAHSEADVCEVAEDEPERENQLPSIALNLPPERIPGLVGSQGQVPGVVAVKKAASN